jgi:predicted transcriptional regulator
VGIMDLLKEATVETIKRLPDGCSVEDIMYEINFVAQVLEGLKDAEDGKLLTTEELLTKVEQWGK